MIRNIFARERLPFACQGPSMTEQSHRVTCNINSIIDRSRRTGTVPVVSSEGDYGDFTQVTDFHSAQNQLTQAQENFYNLPAKVRQRFQNDPGRLIAFLADEANRKEAEELGIIERKKAVETPEQSRIQRIERKKAVETPEQKPDPAAE